WSKVAQSKLAELSAPQAVPGTPGMPLGTQGAPSALPPGGAYQGAALLPGATPGTGVQQNPAGINVAPPSPPLHP
ncbi:MAG TPA: hypothetical protein V6D22_09605, partial [Candidatus Obscuribacterales bacterium]